MKPALQLLTAWFPAATRLGRSFTVAGALLLLAGCSEPAPPHALQVVRSAPEELPFHLEDGVPVVNCRINGRDARLQLDTGSDAVALFDKRAERFGVHVAGRHAGQSYTAGGATTHRAGSDFTLELGTRTEIRVTRPMLYPVCRHPSDGILPVSVLRELRASLDFKRRVLLLHP